MSRPASFFERYYIHRDTTGIMNRGFNVSVQYKQHISDALLSNALKNLVPTHYYFYSNAFRAENEGLELLEKHHLEEDAKNGGKNYHVRPVHQVLYSDLVQKCTVDTFDDGVFESLSHIRVAVNVEKPTYYLTLLEEATSGLQYVVFSCNHLFFDGTSAVHFLQDLTRELARVPADSEPVELLFEHENASVTVEPAGDSKCALYRSPVWFKVWSLMKLMVPDFMFKVYRSYLRSDYPNFFRDPVFTVASFKSGSDSRFRMLKYGPAHTAKILHKCRQNGTTLTAFLTAQFATCVEKSFLPHLGHFSSSVSIAVNGRRYYPDLDLRYGLYIAPVVQYLVPKKGVLSGAAQISTALNSCFQTRRPFMLTGLLEHVNIWRYMQDHIETGERGTIEVSNLGVITISETGWEPEQIFFSQSVTDTHFVCSCVSTKEGGLNIMVAYHKSLETFEWRGERTVEKCIEDFREEMMR